MDKTNWLSMSAVVTLGLSQTGAAKETRVYEMEPIVVTATRTPVRQSETGRAIEIISSRGLIPGKPLADLLGQATSLDLRVRGGHGVQSDLGIRGATYSQILVLVDGQRVNDPQTGHHHLNLPLAASSLERLEILRGHASAQYGADAFGGVVNLCTRSEPRGNRASGGMSTGSFGFQRSFAAIRVGGQGPDGSLSWEEEKGKGYREDTEFRTATLTGTGGLRLPHAHLRGTAGRQTKAFGANQFYGPAPSWEETQAQFGSLRGEITPSQGWTLEPKVWVRTHSDSFVYDRTRPASYANKHQTRVLGGELQTVLKQGPRNRWAVGIGYMEERITSNRLGNHRREASHAFAQEENEWGRFRTTLALRGDHYTTWGTDLSPSLALAYRMEQGLTIRGAFGRAFRVPSFTELYYSDPANRGNAALVPEQAWNSEVGGDINRPRFTVSLTAFLRDSKNLIDWTKPVATPSAPWQVTNLREDRLYGVETELSVTPHTWIALRSTLTEIFARTGLPSDVQSKYAYTHPQRTLRGGTTLLSRCDLNARYVLREGDPKGYTVLDGELRQGFHFGKRIQAAASLAGTNLSNTAYQDFQGIPLEPRSAALTFSVETDL